MLDLVKINPISFNKFRGIISDSLYNEVLSAAEPLKGKKVIHINATPTGGGVSEVLRNLVPILQDIGIKVEWHTLPPDDEFFAVTKRLHNCLQGEKTQCQEDFSGTYKRYTDGLNKRIDKLDTDIFVIHDPQPAGLIPKIKEKGTPVIWRVHIDTSSPEETHWQFMIPYVTKADKVIFTSPEFSNSHFGLEKVEYIAPAINPLTEMNVELEKGEAEEITRSLGVDPNKPLLVQVSRFDPWKDPLGVIQVYREVKKEVPDLQLAYLGLKLAKDDPEADSVYEKFMEKAGEDKDIHAFFDPAVLEGITVDKFVNAFQSSADVVIQKSIREGFGLTVTEAMWKGKPVVAGNVGGIKLQIENGVTGYLCSDTEEYVERIKSLLKDGSKIEEMGKKAKEHVRQNFLMPRLVRDHLWLYAELLKN